MDRAMKITKRQCQLAFFSAAVVVICVCVGVTMNLTTIADENFDHMGLRTFCMFTVNSNILCAAAMAMVIPYTLDGLRTHNYHMPRWIVDLVYMGVTAVALTFLVSLFILSPAKGFVLIFTGSRFFLHGVCPILAIVAFCFFMSEKRLTIRDSLLALIPVLIYAVVYYVMVAIVGEEKGGWNDFYGFLSRLPHWIPLTAIMPLTFLIATGIRVLHNRSYDKRKADESAFFTQLFADADVRKIVAAMARSHSSAKILDIVIPSRIITIMLEHSKSDATLEECCEIYLKEYLENSEVLHLEKYWI
jgi:hypothetical protein